MQRLMNGRLFGTLLRAVLLLATISPLVSLVSCSSNSTIRVGKPSQPEWKKFSEALNIPEEQKKLLAEYEEEDGKNESPLPAELGKTYALQFRHKTDNKVRWAIFNGPNFIGTAEIVYLTKPTIKVENGKQVSYNTELWYDIRPGLNVPVLIVSERRIFNASGKSSILIAKQGELVFFQDGIALNQ